MKGRRVPPAGIPIVVLPEALPGDPSQDVDYAFFRAHPTAHAYIRDLIVGEVSMPLPPGTRVLVQRTGATRARAFIPPEEGLN